MEYDTAFTRGWPAHAGLLQPLGACMKGLALSLCAGLFCASLLWGQQLQGRFYPEKDGYMVGEPLFFGTEIKNIGSEPVYIWAKKQGECLDVYEFSVQKDGFSCGNKWDNGCLAEPLLLKPGESFRHHWPLDNWYRFDHQDKYEVTITHRLYLSSARGGVEDFTFSSKFTLRLGPADAQAMQNILQGFQRDLESSDPEVRHAALDTVATTAPSYFEPTILRLARDRDAFKVQHAIAALRRMNTPQGRAALADILTAREANSEDEISVRFHALQALGESGDASYLPLVSRYMQDKASDDQLAAMIAVAKLGRNAAELQRFLLTGDLATRKNAAYALRFMVNPDAVGALIGALSDKDSGVRDRVAKSLVELTGHSVSVANNNGVPPEEIQRHWRAWWLDNSGKVTLIDDPGFVCWMK